ncbi:hypothetical protein [Sinorhizobium fredii]|uniref:hypothetical protein n=1 Tax=Rhizobium fredii TaxID=380 RepID=UPI00339B4947
MKSNGFGRWEQKIVVHVDKESRDRVAAILGIASFKEAWNPARAYFEWTRLATKRGDDEDVVWELSGLLGIGGSPDWNIDWDASEY